MLDPSLCVNGSLSGIAGNLSWKLFNWLASPNLVIPAILAIIALPWSIQRFPWKRQTSIVGALLLLIYLTALTPKTVALGNRILVSFLPSDIGSRADAIVVLGRGDDLTPSRADVAAQLWFDKRAPMIVSSGIGDAEKITELLKDRGIPESALDIEPCSRTTEENARFTATILKPKHVKQILLVTDPPHMLRSLLTFSSLGFDVTPHLSPLPPDLNPKEKAFLVFREYLGMISYGLQGRFLHREPQAADTA